MGLFDIFKRRNKKAPQSETPKRSEESDQPELNQQLSSSEAPVSSSASEEASSEISSAANESDNADSKEATEPKDQASDEQRETSDVAQSSASGEPNRSSDVASIESDSDDEPVAAEPKEVDQQLTETPSAESAAADSTAADEPTSESAELDTEDSATDTKDVEPAEPDKPQEPEEPEEPEETAKYEHGLAKSRSTFGQRLNKLFANFRSVDEDFFDDLEDTLIESDVGFDTAVNLTDQLRDEVKLRNVKSKNEVQNVVVQKLIELYDQNGNGEKNTINFAKEGPTIILFVGVNGVGKTTTIGKMAKLYHDQGKKVLLAAADTFRAGAIQQLDVWAQRDGVDIVKKPEKSDPASVVFEAVQKAKKEQYDVLFVDTAGRLQNKVNLMNELSKMKKILTREIPMAPHEVMLVLDATTGQNALNQAKLFKQVTDVTGITLTKLDGTAKGGIVLAIRNELHIPVKYVGLGEQVGDLQPFNASDFVYGLFKGLLK